MIGRKIQNRYEVQEHLGDGSTATVYKALDTRLGRQVALKVLLPHVRETTRKRFFQEALAAAQLNHPNIMAIYDIGDEDDYHFLVVEYVEGVSLSYYVPSPPHMVVNLGKQIASALQYAHAHYVIHRDIKPANIKVTPTGVVKIMDLGLALPREATRVTADGMVIGTPAYLSPEQAQGHTLDHRTDIYSLGVVLYEMATGHLPFDADEIPALLLQQVKQPPPPPRLIAPDLPVELERVILKTLEKNPVRRYQTAEALASALDSVIVAEPDAPAIDDKTQPRKPTDDAAPHNVTQGGRLVTRRTKPTIRVLMADDHTILRKALASFLESRDDFVVVGEAADGAAALKETLALLPDVLLLDLNMPVKGGLEIIPSVRAEAPNVKILVLTGREEDWYIMRALRAGAHGYILKNADENELVDGIIKVTQGQMVLGQGVAERIVTGLVGGDADLLNVNERQVLLYVAAGFENADIAKHLQLNQTVIIETLARAMNKLNAEDRNQAAMTALRQGLISMDELHDLG
jgi:DNA-binding NarL/FixJ family response regulator/tRNA A-37 threonylcarbamoyl transferase component Bud32